MASRLKNFLIGAGSVLEICPPSRRYDFTAGILKKSEHSAAHRIELTCEVVEARIRDMHAARRERFFGQIVAFITAMTAVISGSIIATMGEPYVGAAIVGVCEGGLITAFIYGRRSKDRERHIAKQ